jgi:hypothetical protein
MNKKEKRAAELKKHYAFLFRLTNFLGCLQDEKKLSLKLYKLEREAHKAATDYCNGENGMDIEKWEVFKEQMQEKVRLAFGLKVPGLIINGDARGYALKIDDEKVRDFYPASIGCCRDWGGYGILSPDIE